MQDPTPTRLRPRALETILLGGPIGSMLNSVIGHAVLVGLPVALIAA